MAKHNPFSVFRRNQKAWMAGLTLFTMFSFIALGSMVQCVGTGGQQNGAQYGAVAKTAKYGTLDEMAFQTARDNATRLARFARTALFSLDAEAWNQTAQMAQFIPESYLVQFYISSLAEKDQEMAARAYALDRFATELEFALNNSQAMVDRWLVLQFAYENGMAANDDDAKQELARLVSGGLTDEAWQAALNSGGLSERYLLDLLKEQVAYSRAVSKYALPNSIAATRDMAEAFEATNRSMKANVAAFNAADYVDQVAEPSEAELKKFYEQYRNVTANASSATPGFSQPTKIALEVVRAEITDEVLASITDEEIQKYYDEHREEFKKPVAPPAAPELPTAETLQLPGVDGSAAVIPDSILDAAPAVEEAPATEEAAPAVEEAPATEEPAPAVEAAPATEEAAPAVEAAPATEEAAPAVEETPATEEAAPAVEEAPATEEAAPAEEPTAYKQAEILLVSYQQEVEEPAPAEEAPATEEAAPAEEASATEEAAPAEEASEYYPLDEVKDRIRRTLAREKVGAKLDELNAKFSAYYDQYKTLKAEGADLAALEDVDAKAFADENGFGYYVSSAADEEGNVVPVVATIEEAHIAEALPINELATIYERAPLPYRAKKLDFDAADAAYVYRAIDVQAENSPEFEEARDYVLAAWKLREAAKLAQAAADKFAESAKAEGADFAALAAEAKAVVVETEAFSLLEASSAMPGMGNAQVQLAEVREKGVELGEAFRDNQAIIAPGWDFNETAFGMNVGDVAVVANQPKDRVFVLTISEKDPEPTSEELAPAADDPTVQQAADVLTRVRVSRFSEKFFENLREEAGFEWVSIPRDDR